MAPIDWALLGGYLVFTLVLGLWLARRNSGEEDYFVAGRRLSGWLVRPWLRRRFRSIPPFTSLA